MRLVLVGQDLSGQTIKGQPFSYVGGCTGDDVRFTGDWQLASFYDNTFIRPDWSKAKTLGMLSLHNAFTEPVLPPDLDGDGANLDLMRALFRQGRSQVTATTAIDGVITELDAQSTAHELSRKSWPNLAPEFAAHYKNGKDAIAAFSAIVGGNPDYVSRFVRTYQSDPQVKVLDDSVPPDMPSGGAEITAWGLVARNVFDGRELRLARKDFPPLANAYDRYERADQLEALIEGKTGQEMTVLIMSDLPLRGRVGGKGMTRLELL